MKPDEPMTLSALPAGLMHFSGKGVGSQGRFRRRSGKLQGAGRAMLDCSGVRY